MRWAGRSESGEVMMAGLVETGLSSDGQVSSKKRLISIVADVAVMTMLCGKPCYFLNPAVSLLWKLWIGLNAYTNHKHWQ